jgi:hypothetical protein
MVKPILTQARFITKGSDMQWALGLKSEASATGTPFEISLRAGGYFNLRRYAVTGKRTAKVGVLAIASIPASHTL